MPKEIKTPNEQANRLMLQNLVLEKGRLARYQNSHERPYLHLLDGGLTDNLGLASLLDISNLMGLELLYATLEHSSLRHIVVINVNAQNEVANEIDKSADIPGITEVVNIVINVPIDKATETTLQYSKQFTKQWNAYANLRKGKKIKLHFVNLNLKDLPEGGLKKDVLNIGTSFYLPKSDVDKLRESAKILLQQSEEYQQALKILQ